MRLRSVALRVCRGKQRVRQCCRARSQVLPSSSGIQSAVIPLSKIKARHQGTPCVNQRSCAERGRRLFSADTESILARRESWHRGDGWGRFRRLSLQFSMAFAGSRKSWLKLIGVTQ